MNWKPIVVCGLLALACFGAAGWVNATADPTAYVTEQADRGVAIKVTDTIPPPPHAYSWTGPIPAYYAGLGCSRDQATDVAVVMHAKGASDSTVIWMLYTISRESGCREWVHNVNANTGDDSYSLCQLNARAGHFGSNGVLYGWDRWRMLDDFLYAAMGCAEMWSVCGRGPWQPPYSCKEPVS